MAGLSDRLTGFPRRVLMDVLAAAFLPTLLATIVATRVILAWLHKKQILDHPNDRSSHQWPTPRGGGLAVTPIILLAWTALAGLGCGVDGQGPVIVGAAIVLLLSWQDDKGHLPARIRLFIHFAACVLGLAGLGGGGQLIFQGLAPFWLDRLLAIFLWVWFLNLYNFMDGIDGITGVETICIAGGLVLLGGSAGPLAVAVLAAGCGFLVWNWHPARIFLGDSGSVPLGYLLGWLLLRLALEGQWAAALILPAYYLADATLTLLVRLWRKEAFWQAHRQHFYQKAVRAGARHDQVAGLIMVVDLMLLGLAWIASSRPWPALAATAVLVSALLIGLARWNYSARPRN